MRNPLGVDFIFIGQSTRHCLVVHQYKSPLNDGGFQANFGQPSLEAISRSQSQRGVVQYLCLLWSHTHADWPAIYGSCFATIWKTRSKISENLNGIFLITRVNSSKVRSGHKNSEIPSSIQKSFGNCKPLHSQKCQAYARVYWQA